MVIMERKKIWFLISGLLILPGVISLVVWRLHLGIEFQGGSLATLTTDGSGEEGRAVIENTYRSEKILISTLDSESMSDQIRYYVKSPSMSGEIHTNIVRQLSEANPAVTELSFESIDPQVGSDVTRKAFLAIIVASVAIIAYIAFSFRGIPKPASSLQFGVMAVVALLHDVIFILGFMSLMGHFFNWEIKAEFVTAALTVMGFSVHDTIVVFDRLRENMKRNPSLPFSTVANMSIAQTLSRSINTSLTVVLPLLAIALLGGETIRTFSITLLVGIVAGTYSSIFFATPLLDWWISNNKRFRFFKFRWPKLKRRLSRKTRILSA